MAKYKITVTKNGYAEIEADSEVEALKKAYRVNYNWQDDADFEIFDIVEE